MTRNKVIYVSYMHLSEKIARDWYLNFLIEKGVCVEYWDITHLVFGKEQRTCVSSGYVRVPDSYAQLSSWVKLSENSGARYVMLVEYEGRTVELYRLLSRHCCSLVKISWGYMPIKQRGKTVLGRLRSLADPSAVLSRVYYKLKAMAFRKLGLISPFDLVFAAGRVMVATKHYARKIVPINLVDYDHYNNLLKLETRVVKARYAVFLDVNLPYHSDLRLINHSYIDANSYFASLRRFFAKVESAFGIKVIVAAHPHANYGADTFPDQAIYQGLTPDLVRDAEFVISHHSTSISYAILNQKPIIFIYTDDISKAYKHTFYGYLQDFAEYLDASLWNIDAIGENSLPEFNSANLKRYRQYKYDYLTTSESDGFCTKDIFLREVLSSA